MEKRNWFYIILQVLLAFLTVLVSILRPINYPVVNEIAPAVVAALVAGGATLVNTISNNIAQRRAIREQNEYNEPVNQIARYQAAGLNPNLIYGTGQASAGNQSSPAAYQGVHTSTQDALNMANAIMQLRNMDANTRKANAEAQVAENQAIGTGLDNDQKTTFLQQYSDRLTQELENAKLAAAYKRGEITLQQYQQGVLLAQAAHLNQQVAESRYKVRTYLPGVLAVNRANLQLGLDRLAWEKNDWNPLNILHRNQAGLVDYNLRTSPSAGQRRFLEFGGLVRNLSGAFAPFLPRFREFSGTSERFGSQGWSADYVY